MGVASRADRLRTKLWAEQGVALDPRERELILSHPTDNVLELGKEDSVPNETDPIHLSSEKPPFVQENKKGVKEIKDVKKRVKNLVQNLLNNGHCKVRLNFSCSF